MNNYGWKGKTLEQVVEGKAEIKEEGLLPLKKGWG